MSVKHFIPIQLKPLNWARRNAPRIGLARQMIDNLLIDRISLLQMLMHSPRGALRKGIYTTSDTQQSTTRR
jgi:hypothetical protein